MATASVTHTFVDGTTGDAVEVNQNFTDLVNFLNASVVHADGGVPMTGVLDLGDNGFTNPGPSFVVYRSFSNELFSLNVSGSWRNYAPPAGNLNVTVTDPNGPVSVLAWATLSHMRTNDQPDALLSISIDDELSGQTRSAAENTGFWKHLSHFSMRSFTPTGSFVVKPQVQITADEQDFRYAGIMALVIPA